MKQKKQMKLKSSQTDSDDMLELLTSKKDETKLKNKKKSKKNLKEGSNPVEEHQSLSDRINAGTPKLKKDRRSSDEPNNADEVLHGNQDEETPTGSVSCLLLHYHFLVTNYIPNSFTMPLSLFGFCKLLIISLVKQYIWIYFVQPVLTNSQQRVEIWI